jgi:hypothetical protein
MRRRASTRGVPGRIAPEGVEAHVRVATYARAVRLHGHVMCDTPGCDATQPDDSPKLAAWEVITGNDAPDADLCDVCADRKARGVLTDPFGLQCARCGRTRDDGVTDWWGFRDDAGRPIDVCNDCRRDDDVTATIGGA